jgi:hypothetical protein
MGSPYNKQPMKYPWVTGMHGVPQCGKTQHCTCTCDTRDWKTAGLPIPVLFPRDGGCGKGSGWVWVCKGGFGACGGGKTTCWSCVALLDVGHRK